MQQAVQECRHIDRVMKQFGPVGDIVGRDNGAGHLIPIGNESEKEYYEQYRETLS